jgi:hypothetical protein
MKSAECTAGTAEPQKKSKDKGQKSKVKDDSTTSLS